MTHSHIIDTLQSSLSCVQIAATACHKTMVTNGMRVQSLVIRSDKQPQVNFNARSGGELLDVSQRDGLSPTRKGDQNKNSQVTARLLC